LGHQKLFVQGEYLASRRTEAGLRFDLLELMCNTDTNWGRITPLDGEDRSVFFLSGPGSDTDQLCMALESARNQPTRTGSIILQSIKAEDGASVLQGQRILDGIESSAYIAERNERLLLRPSPTHGRGVFTTEKIAAGECITIVRGEQTDKQTKHSVRISPGLHCDPSGYLRFVNHSCQANSVINASQAPDLVLEASRDIRAGEEITFDYIENEGEIVGGFECACDADTHHF